MVERRVDEKYVTLIDRRDRWMSFGQVWSGCRVGAGETRGGSDRAANVMMALRTLGGVHPCGCACSGVCVGVRKREWA